MCEPHAREQQKCDLCRVDAITGAQSGECAGRCAQLNAQVKRVRLTECARLVIVLVRVSGCRCSVRAGRKGVIMQMEGGRGIGDRPKRAGVRCTVDWATRITLAIALCGFWAFATQTHASNTRQSINRSVVTRKNRSDENDVNTLGLRRMLECTSHRSLSQHDLPIMKSCWRWLVSVVVVVVVGVVGVAEMTDVVVVVSDQWWWWWC
jgi:hypothetical protein